MTPWAKANVRDKRESRFCQRVLIPRTARQPENAMDFDTAVSLTSEEYSCVVQEHCQLEMPMLPAALRSPEEAILVSLKQNVNRFRMRWNGIPLAFANVTVTQSLVAINDSYSASAIVPFEYDVCVFRPRVGKRLRVTVKEIRSGHIVCIAHKLFNVTIIRSGTDKVDVKAGDQMVVRVEQIRRKGALLWIAARFTKKS